MSIFINTIRNIAKRPNGNAITLNPIFNNGKLGIIIGERAIFEDDTVIPHLGWWVEPSSMDAIASRISEHPRMACVMDDSQGCDIYGTPSDFITVLSLDDVIAGASYNTASSSEALKYVVNWMMYAHACGVDLRDE